LVTMLQQHMAALVTVLHQNIQFLGRCIQTYNFLVDQTFNSQ
jgi:hypothetical protein